MSAALFQAAMARLVIDPGFRERVARGAGRHLPSRLSGRERSRLVAVANHRGLDITRMMYVSFRLSRIQAGVPHTFRLLGRRRLKAELSRYIDTQVPTSFYFADEGRALLGYLRARVRQGALELPYLADVAAYEEALLDLQDARNRGVDATVAFHVEHDLAAILRTLDAGRRPRRIPRRRVAFEGRLRDGRIELAARPFERSSP